MKKKDSVNSFFSCINYMNIKTLQKKKRTGEKMIDKLVAVDNF